MCSRARDTVCVITLIAFALLSFRSCAMGDIDEVKPVEASAEEDEVKQQEPKVESLAEFLKRAGKANKKFLEDPAVVTEGVAALKANKIKVRLHFVVSLHGHARASSGCGGLQVAAQSPHDYVANGHVGAGKGTRV